MTWEKGEFSGSPPACRHGHTSTAIGPHLMIFGGWQQTVALNTVVILRDLASINS